MQTILNCKLFQSIKNRVKRLILLNRFFSGIINRLKQENSRLKYWEKCRNANSSFKPITMHKIDQDRFQMIM